MTLLVLLLQCILLIVVMLLLRRQTISPILRVALLFYSLLWYILPVTLGILVSRSDFNRALIETTVYLNWVLLETAVLIVSLLLLFRQRPFSVKMVNSSFSRFSVSERLSVLILLLGIVWLLMSWLGSTASYWERNALLASANESELINVGVVGFAWRLILSFASVLILENTERIGIHKLRFFLSLALISGSTFVDILRGSRIGLLTPIMFVLMYAIVHQWQRPQFIRTLVFAGVITVIAGISLSAPLADLRGGTALSAREVTSEALDFVSSSNVKYLLSSFHQEIVTKFDNISAGAFLVESLGPGFAGTRPYVGALLAVVPRFIVPDKPIPGSIDNSYLGHPSRLVPILSGSTSLSSNMGVSPAAISVWQFGHFGPLLVVIFNVFNLYLVNTLLLSSSIISKTLGFSMLGLPALAVLFASPDQLILVAERVLLIYFALLLIIVAVRRDDRYVYYTKRGEMV